ncbi:MAG: MBL fold metallo-hydrolase [Planctomycetota bacterium]|jgi:metallo-beta-lactamase family protein
MRSKVLSFACIVPTAILLFSACSTQEHQEPNRLPMAETALGRHCEQEANNDNKDALPTKCSVSVYGAAGEVSGSLLVLDTGNGSWLIDCGAFYPDGPGTAEERNIRAAGRNMELPKDARGVSAVFITHAHLDHIGRLPKLIRAGYKGPIYGSDATTAIAAVMLEMQVRYYRFQVRKWVWSRKSEQKGFITSHWMPNCEWRNQIAQENIRMETCSLDDLAKKPMNVSPCKTCSKIEVETILRLFKTVPYGRAFTVAKGVHATFYDAGHIPGSASILLEVKGRDLHKRMLFSGDLGNHLSTLISGPKPAPASDVVFVETTYGDHERASNIAEQFKIFRREVGKAVANNEIVWIPSYALDRTQKILHQLSIGAIEGTIPKDVPIICPLSSARRISHIYRKGIADRKGWFRPDIEGNPSQITPNGLAERYPKRGLPCPCVVITASGMMDKIFSKSLLAELLPKAHVHVFLVGWQDPGSPGDQLMKRERVLTVDGKRIVVNASVHDFGCFSGHGDAKDIDQWLNANNHGVRIVLVHGDKEALARRKDDLIRKGYRDVRIAEPTKKYDFGKP